MAGHFLQVHKPVHNATGYWGSCDTTVSFCEPHYNVSEYIAEFHNAWSSLASYAIVGYYLYRKFGKDCYIRTAGCWLMGVGVGSCLFHATMKFWMQMCDEGPMVGFMATLMLGKANSKNHGGIVKYSSLISTWIYFQCFAVIALYLYYDVYEIFLHGFTCICVTDVILGHLLLKSNTGPHSRLQWQALGGSTVFIVLGRLVWEIEKRYCSDMPSVWPLHTVWHFLSCGSAYYSCLMTYLCRVEPDMKLSQSLLFGLHVMPKQQQDMMMKKKV